MFLFKQTTTNQKKGKKKTKNTNAKFSIKWNLPQSKIHTYPRCVSFFMSNRSSQPCVCMFFGFSFRRILQFKTSKRMFWGFSLLFVFLFLCFVFWYWVLFCWVIWFCTTLPSRTKQSRVLFVFVKLENQNSLKRMSGFIFSLFRVIRGWGLDYVWGWIVTFNVIETCNRIDFKGKIVFRYKKIQSKILSGFFSRIYFLLQAKSQNN